MKTPLLFLIFNRPDLTRESFRVVQTLKPEKLYIAADGPRSNIDGELELVKEVRNIVEEVDWVCEVKRCYQDNNKGCKRAASSKPERLRL